MAPSVAQEWDYKPTGTIDIGGFKISWDFTELYREREIQERQQCFIHGGRTIMPALGII